MYEQMYWLSINHRRHVMKRCNIGGKIRYDKGSWDLLHKPVLCPMFHRPVLPHTPVLFFLIHRSCPPSSTDPVFPHPLVQSPRFCPPSSTCSVSLIQRFWPPSFTGPVLPHSPVLSSLIHRSCPPASAGTVHLRLLVKKLSWLTSDIQQRDTKIVIVFNVTK